MQLAINNLTGGTLTYLSGAISVPANSTVTVTNTTQLIQLAINGVLRSDLFANNISVGDGTNNFGAQDGITYLYEIPQILGPLSDAAGNAITSTTSGAKQALDTNIAISLPAGSATIGAVNQGTGAALSSYWPVRVTDGTNTLPTMDVVARAGFQKLTDGTNGPVAVKPASTAPLATDSALVVTLSPNSPASPPISSTSGSGTISALNGSVIVSPPGSAVTWSMSGTWVGTLTTQAQGGDGQWWNVASLSNQSGLITNGTSINGVLEMNAAGWIQARIVATAWTSGTATVTWNATSGEHLLIPYSSNGANFNTYTTLTDSSQNPLGTTPASTAATTAQEALVVAFSPNSPLPAGTSLLGSINQGTSPWITKDQSDGPVTPGTVASFSQLAGGQFNTALPALSNTQQSSIQLDSSGRIIVSPLTNASIVKAQVQDNSGNGITSTTINSKQRLDVNLSSEGTDNTAVPFGTQLVGGEDTTGKLQSLITLPSGELFVRDVINVSSQYQDISLSTTATEAKGAATRLVNRKVLVITPTNGTIYWATNTSVTTANGLPIFANQTLMLAFTDNVPVYIIAAATVDVRVLEGS